MPYILILEGQQIPLADEVAANNQTLRDTLTPFYPEVATADINREEKDGVTLIRIVKKAGTKGGLNILQNLIESEQTLNPALTLSWQLKMLEVQGGMNIENLLLVQAEINSAITTGKQWETEVERSLTLLKQSPPIPSQATITGF